MLEQAVTEITLHTPVDFGGQRVERLIFREMTAGDLRGTAYNFNKAPVIPHEDIIKVAARLTGQPTGVIEMLRQRDYAEVFIVVAPLLLIGQETGEASSPA